MNTTTLKKTLLCALSDDERRTYGIKLATTLEDMEAVEGEKKRQADHFKDRIGGLQATADELRRKVSTGQEWRDVECSVTYGVPMPDRKTTTRGDTGEVVAVEWMTEADKQRELPLDIDGEVVVDCDTPPDEIETPEDAPPTVVDESKPAKRKKADAQPMPSDDAAAPQPAGDDY